MGCILCTYSNRSNNFSNHFKLRNMETLLFYFLGGLFGILVHNLIKLNKINKKQKGNTNLGEYWNMERFDILISISVVIVALIAQNEIKQLQTVGNYMMLSFFAIGYMAQSIVVSYAGRAENILKINSEKED